MSPRSFTTKAASHSTVLIALRGLFIDFLMLLLSSLLVLLCSSALAGPSMFAARYTSGLCLTQGLADGTRVKVLHSDRTLLFVP